VAATLVIRLLVIARIAIIKLPTGWFAGSLRKIVHLRASRYWRRVLHARCQ
jgi:hypothetical protein